MVTETTLKLPIIGDFVKHIREGNTPEIVKDSLRVVVAAVAVVALGVFPSLTARIAATPYIGAALNAFHSLSPMTQRVLVVLTSLPAFGIAMGVGYIASAVAILAQAHMTLSVITVLDVLSRLFAGAMLLHHYRLIEFGAAELAVDEAQRTRFGSTQVDIPKVEVRQEQVTMTAPVPHVVGRERVTVPTVDHSNSADRAARGLSPTTLRTGGDEE